MSWEIRKDELVKAPDVRPDYIGKPRYYGFVTLADPEDSKVYEAGYGEAVEVRLTSYQERGDTEMREGVEFRLFGSPEVHLSGTLPSAIEIDFHDLEDVIDELRKLTREAERKEAVDV